jgi:hypothetical protein
LHLIDNKEKDKKHGVVEERTVQRISKKLLVVGNEAEGRLMDQKMKLAKVN